MPATRQQKPTNRRSLRIARPPAGDTPAPIARLPLPRPQSREFAAVILPRENHVSLAPKQIAPAVHRARPASPDSRRSAPSHARRVRETHRAEVYPGFSRLSAQALFDGSRTPVEARARGDG